MKSRPYILGFILLLGFALRIWDLGGESLWYDELVTLDTLLNNSLRSIPGYVLHREGAPPLYFLLLKIWTLFRLTPYQARLFSVIWGTLSIWGIYLLGKEMGEERWGKLAGGLLAVSPYAIWYSQEARMYSFLLFLVIFSSLYFLKFLKNPGRKNLLLYLLLTLAMLYTHPHALFIYFVHLLILLFKRKHPYAYWSILPLILYLPYLRKLFSLLQDPRTSWLPPLTPSTPYFIFYHFIWGLYPGVGRFMSLAGFIVFFSLFAWGTYLLVKERRYFLLLSFYTPFFLLLVLSLYHPMIFEGRRYLIIILPFFYLITLYPLRKSPFLLPILILFLLFPLREIYSSIQKRPWDKAVKMIKSEAKPGDAYLILGLPSRILRVYSLDLPYLDLPSRVTADMVRRKLHRYQRIWIFSLSSSPEPLEKFLAREGKYRILHLFRTSRGAVLKIGLYSP